MCCVCFRMSMGLFELVGAENFALIIVKIFVTKKIIKTMKSITPGQPILNPFTLLIYVGLIAHYKQFFPFSIKINK